MTNLERGRLARYRQSGSDFRRPRRKAPRLRDYRLAGDFPPSLRYGAAGARNNKNGM